MTDAQQHDSPPTDGVGAAKLPFRVGQTVLANGGAGVIYEIFRQTDPPFRVIYRVCKFITGTQWGHWEEELEAVPSPDTEHIAALEAQSRAQDAQLAAAQAALEAIAGVSALGMSAYLNREHMLDRYVEKVNDMKRVAVEALAARTAEPDGGGE